MNPIEQIRQEHERLSKKAKSQPDYTIYASKWLHDVGILLEALTPKKASPPMATVEKKSKTTKSKKKEDDE